MQKLREQDLYPRIERWLKRQFLCFASATNTGLIFSRPDVIGLRDVGGDFSGEVETIIIEVKRGNQPFATASGQALGYKIYANRVYLADLRDTPFTQDELHIASHLGIGLIHIRKSRITEVLSSPYHKPITKLNLALLERICIGYCQICGSAFRTGEPVKGRRYAYLTRENLKAALDEEKGVVFWNRELADRKAKLGVRNPRDEKTYERRFICPDCVGYLMYQLGHDDDQ